MKYSEAVDFVKQTKRFGCKLGLETVTELLARLDNPHRRYQVVHVAGTNGKGSTCAMLSSILREAGFRTGLFTSPHLSDWRERIVVDGEWIDKRSFSCAAETVQQTVSAMLQAGYAHPTEFEIVTAIGFQCFWAKKVDFAVVEVGLGGRLDATNVVLPMLSIVTPVSFDHQIYLGTHLEDIAAEKAGIIKKNIPLVLAKQDPRAKQIIVDAAAKKNALIYECFENSISFRSATFEGQCFDYASTRLTVSRLVLPLLGQHQLINASTVLRAVEVLRLNNVEIPEKAIRRGLEKVRWPGRLELFRIADGRQIVVLDGAHNEAGADMLNKSFEELFPRQSHVLVVGMLNDKDIEAMLKYLTAYACKIIITKPDYVERAAEPEQIKDILAKLCKIPAQIIENPHQAVSAAVCLAKNCGCPLVIAGSLYLVGAIRKDIVELTK